MKKYANIYYFSNVILLFLILTVFNIILINSNIDFLLNYEFKLFKNLTIIYWYLFFFNSFANHTNYSIKWFPILKKWF